MLDFILITLVIVIVVQWFQSKPFFWRNAGIPYVVPLPIFGNVGSALLKPYYEVFDSLYKKIGDSPALGFHLFGTPALIAGDPHFVKRITVTDADCFTSHGFHTNPDSDPLGKSLFFVDGQEWKTVRGKMTVYFTPSRIKGMLPMIHPVADNYAEFIRKQSRKGPVNVLDASMRLTVDIVICTVFGLKPDAFENEDSFFYSIQKELISFVMGLKFLLGDMSPALYSLLGLSVLSRNATIKLKRLVNDVVKQRLEGVGKRPDFMQGMVELMKKEDLTETKKKYNVDRTPVAKFDHFSVTGQCMIMYLAGTETTGNTLSFLLYELALQPDIQDKARAEINAMIKKSNGNIGYEELHGLKYMRMLFCETTRKYPVASTYSRRCTKAVNIEGIDIPVGTKIMISPFAMQRDPKYFPQPEKFMPERFEDESNISPGTFVPFGMGPRTCIGMSFAETEIALSLCKLLPKMKLSVSNKTEIPLIFSSAPTLSALNGIWLQVEEL